MIKAILFDFDGVLTVDKTGSESILNYIAEKTNIPLDTLKTEYYKYNSDLLYGRLTHRDIWESLCKSIGYSIEYSILIDSFRNTPIDNEMISFAKELKKSYKIGMITDNKCDRIHEVLSHHDLKDLFDTVSISAEYGSGKEERPIFDITTEKLAVTPEQCIFIDNSPKNLIVPEQIGMRTILFDDENRNVECFRKTLNDIIEKCNRT